MTRQFKWWLDREHPTTRQVVRLACQRQPLSVIKTVAGVTTVAGASLVVIRLQGLYPDLFRDVLHTLPEAAKLVGVKCSTFRRYVQEGLIKPVDDDHPGLFTDKAVLAFRLPVVISLCDRCGKTLAFKGDHRRPTICKAPSLCRDDYNKERRLKYPSKEATDESLRDWRKQLLKGLKEKGAPPDNERWVQHAEACRISGLKSISLCWLRHRRVLTVLTRLATSGKYPSLFVYAESELVLTRQVHEEWEKTHQPKVANAVAS